MCTMLSRIQDIPPAPNCAEPCVMQMDNFKHTHTHTGRHTPLLAPVQRAPELWELAGFLFVFFFKLLTKSSSLNYKPSLKAVGQMEACRGSDLEQSLTGLSINVCLSSILPAAALIINYPCRHTGVLVN